MKLTVAFKHKLSDKFMTRMKQKIIQKWTKSKYFHTEVIIDDEWIESDNDIGVIRHKLQPLKESYDYITIEVKDCPVNKEAVDSFIDSQMGAKYDWTGIYMSQVLKLGIDRADQWFCSEFIVKILQIMSVEQMLYVKPQNISPQALFELLHESEVERLIFS